MAWTHTLPLTITNSTDTKITITLHHKQGNEGDEKWTETIEAQKSSNGLFETSYSDHGDSWWAEAIFLESGRNVSSSSHHWGVQESYVAISCIVYTDGFSMNGHKKGGGVSHHFFKWK
ncbi:MAG: hypothetical protein HRT58_19395 [Crocinitomicaceae bacterium]|nr:hypothetical protein [Flavobacteriales bacterium]NQZ37835.1 hypothetical protein [Crocinitomicaceae bacterium]